MKALEIHHMVTVYLFGHDSEMNGKVDLVSGGFLAKMLSLESALLLSR